MRNRGVYAGTGGQWRQASRDRVESSGGVRSWEVRMRLKNYWSVGTREPKLERQRVVVIDVK